MSFDFIFLIFLILKLFYKQRCS